MLVSSVVEYEFSRHKSEKKCYVCSKKWWPAGSQLTMAHSQYHSMPHKRKPYKT